MKKALALVSVIALAACTYGNPVNNEQFFKEADITAVDWSKVNADGYACQTNILYFIPVGDNSLPRAVNDAKVKKIAYVDTDTTVYPLFSRECTNVWGEAEIAPSMDAFDYATSETTNE